MNVVIETDRLLLRTFNDNDAALLFELNSDPEVTRYTHDSMTHFSEAEKLLKEGILPHYELNRYGRWAAHLKTSLSFIGWCGLKHFPISNEVDLAYRFVRQSWGNGYATEAALACLHYGFKRLSLPRIIGKALPENLGSIRVLEKCGMEYIGEEVAHGYLHKAYQAINPTIR